MTKGPGFQSQVGSSIYCFFFHWKILSIYLSPVNFHLFNIHFIIYGVILLLLPFKQNKTETVPDDTLRRYSVNIFIDYQKLYFTFCFRISSFMVGLETHTYTFKSRYCQNWFPFFFNQLSIYMYRYLYKVAHI